MALDGFISVTFTDSFLLVAFLDSVEEIANSERTTAHSARLA